MYSFRDDGLNIGWQFATEHGYKTLPIVVWMQKIGAETVAKLGPTFRGIDMAAKAPAQLVGAGRNAIRTGDDCWKFTRFVYAMTVWNLLCIDICCAWRWRQGRHDSSSP